MGLWRVEGASSTVLNVTILRHFPSLTRTRTVHAAVTATGIQPYSSLSLHDYDRNVRGSWIKYSGSVAKLFPVKCTGYRIKKAVEQYRSFTEAHSISSTISSVGVFNLFVFTFFIFIVHILHNFNALPQPVLLIYDEWQ